MVLPVRALERSSVDGKGRQVIVAIPFADALRAAGFKLLTVEEPHQPDALRL